MYTALTRGRANIICSVFNKTSSETGTRWLHPREIPQLEGATTPPPPAFFSSFRGHATNAVYDRHDHNTDMRPVQEFHFCPTFRPTRRNDASLPLGVFQSSSLLVRVQRLNLYTRPRVSRKNMTQYKSTDSPSYRFIFSIRQQSFVT